MKLTSVFDSSEEIPAKYTCNNQNINPPLEWHDLPKNTQSLVLIVDDPDAPGGTWTHWLIWNIDPYVNIINENSVPAGAIEGINSSGKNIYDGPCPPSGTHHYFFRLYALDTTLNLNNNTERNALIKAMDGHVLDYSELMGIYKK